MRFTNLRAINKGPIELEYKDGTKLLFSYEHLVAAFVPGRGFLVTTAPKSTTTDERVEQWLRGSDTVQDVPQTELYELITGRPLYDPEQGA